MFARVLALGMIPPLAVVACGGNIDGATVEPEADSGSTGSGGPGKTLPSGDGGYYVDAIALKDGGKKDVTTVMADAEVADVSVADVVSIPDSSVFDGGCAITPQPQDAGVTGCVWYVPEPCSAMQRDVSYFSQQECQAYCGPNALFCNEAPVNGGGNGGGGDSYDHMLECVSCAIGRRPEGFASRSREACSDDGRASIVGRFFAGVAELEAASVFSFERLERELAAHGAPQSLRKRARRAAEDERRHARVTSALANRFGGTPMVPANGADDVRTLEAIALENAVEGCVRETFGALTATIQAERAEDARVRAAMKKIAADETAHASLAWSVASWVATKLDADAQARIRAAIEDAIAGLAREVALEPPVAIRKIAGLPSGREAAALVEGMREMLWAA